MAAQVGDQRDHAGVDAGHQLVGFLALVVAHQHPAGAAGRIGHIGAPLVKDQVEAGAQVVPPFLQRLDPGVATANFEGDGAGRKGLPQLADSRASFSICEFRRRISEEARRSATAALISGIRAQRSSFVIKRDDR